jgi:hypothetical protein
MNNQWPLFLALVIIGGAAGFGLYQREVAIAGAVPVEDVRRLPTAGGSSGPKATAPVEKAVTPERVETPAVLPAQAPVTQQPVVAAPTAPAVAARPRTTGRLQTLLDLQEDLKARLQMVPLPLNNGGYKFAPDGASVEVVTTPVWQITIYNINPKTPEVESENFKLILGVVTAQLGINMNQKPVEAATGKTYLRAVSKMGNISLERDPATGNSAIIRPMVPQAAVDPTPAPANPTAPVAPATGKKAGADF